VFPNVRWAAARGLLIQAAPDVFLGLHLKVKLDFFIDALVPRPPLKQGGNSRSQGTELSHVEPFTE